MEGSFASRKAPPKHKGRTAENKSNLEKIEVEPISIKETTLG